MAYYHWFIAIVVSLTIGSYAGDVVVDQSSNSDQGDVSLVLSSQHNLTSTFCSDLAASSSSSYCASSTTTTTSSAITSDSRSSTPQLSKKNYTWIPEAEHPCNIERLTLNQLVQRFGPQGVPSLYPKPLVIDLQQPQEVTEVAVEDATPAWSSPTKVDHANHYFRQLTHPTKLLDNFPPNYTVTLSSSNSYSEHRRTIPLSQYIQETISAYETTPDALSNETWYLFGETYTAEWQQLLRNYHTPPCHTCSQRRQLVALAFGLGNRGSGVQWHVHGPGFSQAIHGRKHWILAATKPDFHPNTTSRYWMEYEYPKYHPQSASRSNRHTIFGKGLQEHHNTPLYECTLLPGDLLYFPNNWYHATINLDPYTAFVSSFTTEHTMEL